MAAARPNADVGRVRPAEWYSPDVLRDFEANNFRTFSSLRVPRLGRVNLIVGRNNTGKTMLLEALRLFQTRGDANEIVALLAERDEYRRTAPQRDIRREEPIEEARLDLGALFHGRPAELNGAVCRLGPSGEPDQTLTLSIRPARITRDDDGLRQVSLFDEDSDSAEVGGGEVFDRLALVTEVGSERRSVIDLELPFTRRRIGRPRIGEAERRPPFVAARGADSAIVTSWWDALALTDGEERVIECLKLISDIERVALVEGASPRTRTPIVKFKGTAAPEPMRSLGDGFGRLFWVALALENARASKLLLIDELDNGIHYSVLPDLWRFVTRAAIASNVQVFATTHSWDCVEAFQTATIENTEADGVLVKLARRSAQDPVSAVAFDETELATATKQGIDLR